LKKGGGMCTSCNSWKLLFFKHLGSVYGGAFATLLTFVPDLLVSICRKGCSNDNGSCAQILDLGRSDSLSYVALIGSPYCNAAQYCEYLTN